MPYLWHFPGSQDKYAIIDPFMEGEIANETFLVFGASNYLGWYSEM